jgi:uncharacterized protein YgiM (DUF1202 family)
MRSLLAAVVMASASVASVHAGMLTIPVQPLHSGALLVADQEMTVAGNAVNLREKPSTKARVIIKLNAGTKVTAIGASGSWTHVKYLDLDGYVSSKFLK